MRDWPTKRRWPHCVRAWKESPAARRGTRRERRADLFPSGGHHDDDDTAPTAKNPKLEMAGPVVLPVVRSPGSSPFVHFFNSFFFPLSFFLVFGRCQRRQESRCARPSSGCSSTRQQRGIFNAHGLYGLWINSNLATSWHFSISSDYAVFTRISRLCKPRKVNDDQEQWHHSSLLAEDYIIRTVSRPDVRFCSPSGVPVLSDYS